MLRTIEGVNIKHVGWAVKIKLNVSEKVEINGKYIPKIGGSPTTDLRSAITNEMLAGVKALPSQHYLQMINYIYFVDTAGTERDGVLLTDVPVNPNLNTTNFDIGTNNQIKVKGQITASANYSVQKVRLKSGTTTYFEYTLSTTQPVSSGNVYNVVYTIQFSATDTSSGTNASQFAYDFTVICYKLAGVKANAGANNYTWVDPDGTVVYLYLTTNDIRLESTTTADTITITSLTPDSSQSASYLVIIKGQFTPSSSYSGLTWNVRLMFFPSTSSTSYSPSSYPYGLLQWQRAMDFSAGVGYTLILNIQW
jgi:hypothetical protein